MSYRLPNGFVLTDKGIVPTEDADADILPPEDEVRACRRWLRHWARESDQIDRKAVSSYRWKHVVEKGTPETGNYISNGAFIQAALSEGYKMEVIGNGPNARFNIISSDDEWKYTPAYGFTNWLFRQVWRDDPIGDLAKDAREDKRWPRQVRTKNTFRKYLGSRRACPEALEAFENAWRAFNTVFD